jgi:hypothetical protein
MLDTLEDIQGGEILNPLHEAIKEVNLIAV